MLKGSVYNDEFWARIGFEEHFPRITKLLQAIRSRPEFKGILANPMPWHLFNEKFAQLPPGAFPSLSLPIENDE